jgi:hypothetical protein
MQKLLPRRPSDHDINRKLTRINASARAMNDIFLKRIAEGI